MDTTPYGFTGINRTSISREPEWLLSFKKTVRCAMSAQSMLTESRISSARYADWRPRLTGEQVDHPKHYLGHPSGVECIDITEHMNFLLGNAVKYIWRCDYKGSAVQDLEKAVWYLRREIARRAERDITATANDETIKVSKW